MRSPSLLGVLRRVFSLGGVGGYFPESLLFRGGGCLGGGGLLFKVISLRRAKSPTGGGGGGCREYNAASRSEGGKSDRGARRGLRIEGGKENPKRNPISARETTRVNKN